MAKDENVLVVFESWLLLNAESMKKSENIYFPLVIVRQTSLVKLT